MLNQILYTACVTPFDVTGDRIDYQSLEKILRHQDTAGNGIVLLGSTGEGMSLSDEERKAIVLFANNLNLKTQILVGVPNYNLKKALEWLEFCNDLKIDGYLVTPPVYTKPGILGQTMWFERLLEISDHPIMTYNIPGRVGVKLYPEVIKNLEQHPRLLAIKDSSDNIESLIQYKITCPKIKVYSGEDYLMPIMAVEGAVGLISVASNVWPEATRRYVKYSLAQKKLKNKIWWQSCKALFNASNPIPIKALLKDVGIIEHDTLRLPLTIGDLNSRETLLAYHKIMEKWDIDYE